MNRKNVFLTAQLVSYASIIPMLIYSTWYEWIVSLIFYFLFNGIGMIMIYHRLISHRSFQCPEWIEYFGTLFATLALTGSAITWVAMHRKHHRYSDTDKDPHSPDHLGIFNVQFLTSQVNIEPKYAIDLLKNNFYKFQHKYYFHIHAFYISMLILINPYALIYAYLFPASLTLFFGTMVLSLTHKDFQPRNLLWLSILTFGEAFHEVHHTDSKKFRLHKYDFIGFLIQKLFVR